MNESAGRPAKKQLFLWSLTAFYTNRYVFHRAVRAGTDEDGNPVYKPLCGAPVQHNSIVLEQMPPKGRMCRNCEQVAADRFNILKRLVNIRKDAAA